ncbi:hypothetical protein NDU88_008949 [Pleurodeles waltl]|uniref:Uncharacterized protein n=1 Tax=Pleurodeles waltl TaxID=8319 RepID=A0AAV7P6J6_PLEWA|nr:hypothetical protein NDU88_008949 [Pleurodeles waltl]
MSRKARLWRASGRDRHGVQPATCTEEGKHYGYGLNEASSPHFWVWIGEAQEETGALRQYNKGAKQRAAFAAVKKVFHHKNIKYALLYRAKLRIEHEKKTHFLGTPQEAWEWIEMRGLRQANGLGKEGTKTWTTGEKKRKEARA